MKRAVGWLAVLALGVLAYLYGPDMLSHFREKPERKEDPIEVQMLALAQRWGAVAKWQHRIKSRKYTYKTYTIDVERALLEVPGQRFAFAGSVEDVARVSGELFRVIVSPSYFWESALAEVWLDLTCKGEVVRPIVAADSEPLAGYAILATITEVSRPGFRVAKIRSGEDTSLELELPSERVAKGECFEFVPLK